MSYKLKEIAELVKGHIIADYDNIIISGINIIAQAGPEDVTFATSRFNFENALKSRAGAILCKEDYNLEIARALIKVDNPRLAFAKLIGIFNKEEKPFSGIHPSCITGENVLLGKDLSVYANVFIGNNVNIGDSTVIYPGVYIGNNVTIGEDCRIYPNVVIFEKIKIGNRVIIHGGAVLGSDGFGFEKEGNSYYKIPQIGNIIIEDDVEIGANTCIDRGTVGPTRVGRGSKLDNLIQVAHNVSIGEDVVIAGNAGIAGGAVIEDRCSLGGYVGVGSVKIGHDSSIAGKSGVMEDVPPGSKMMGYPAINSRQFFRQLSYISKLPGLFQEVKAMNKELEKFKK